MSLSADRFKHFSRKNIADLCHCLSSVCGQDTDEARGDQTSFKLECLTTCYHWFRSNGQPVNFKNTSDDDFARLIYLVVGHLQTDADPFVLYAARKALRVLLENETSKGKIKEYLHGLLECLGNEEIGTLNKTTILEITSDLLQGELTITVLDVVKQRFPWLVENVLKFPFQEDDSILITTFLITWRKSAKKCQDLQLDLCWAMDYEILLQTINVMSVTENCIYSRQVIYLLKTFYSYGQILCLQSSVNPIYIKLGSAILHWALDKGISNLPEDSATGFGGTCVLVSCKSKLQTEFGNLSSLRQLAALVLSVAATIVRFSHLITEVNVALSDLPRCLSLLNHHATITVHGTEHSGQSVHGTEHSSQSVHGMEHSAQPVHGMEHSGQSVHGTEHSTQTVHGREHSGQSFDWMTTVFGDQDDTLMEALLEVLDIYCITKKRSDTLGPYLEKLTTTINPHKQFYLLLQMTGFDHIVLVDLLTSPETCALLYLTRYLKCVINEWDIFLETLDVLGDRKTSTSEHLHTKSDSGHSLTNIQGTNSLKNSHEDLSKCFGQSYKQSHLTCADDDIKTEDEMEQMISNSIPASEEYVTEIASSIPAPPKSMSESQSEIESSCSESPFIRDLTSPTKTQVYSVIECVKDSIQSADSSIECRYESKSETGSEAGVTCMLGSTGLALLGQYSDDDDSEDSNPAEIPNDRSESDNSKIVTQMETMEIESSTLSKDSPHICGEMRERTGQMESYEVVEICDSKRTINQCLDETMATLIRLRLKMESLCESGLLVYHPGPLIRLITQCEALYEQ